MDAEPNSDDPRRRPEDETVARKRARRVSFADTTAIHIFDRDEDLETPPDSRPPSSPEAVAETQAALSGGGEEHRGEEDDDEDDGEAELFVKDPLDFSPGSAAGSLTSNDDENLFGLVSTSFISSGHISEAPEDANHDITLDSTAFSLHFHNALPHEDRSGFSAGSFRTPTEQSTPDVDHESAMPLTSGKKKFSESHHNDISGDVTVNASRMSLVTETSRRYDYGKLSDSLEALLLKVNESIQMETPMKSIPAKTVDMFLALHNIEATSPENTPVGASASGFLTSSDDQLHAAVDVKSESNATPRTLNASSPSSPNQAVNTGSKKGASPNHCVYKKTLEQSESISSPASSFNLPSTAASNAGEVTAQPLEVGMLTRKIVPLAGLQLKSPLEGSVCSSFKKSGEVFPSSPISLQNQQVPMLGGLESPYSNESGGEDIGRPAATNNKTSSFMGNDHPIVETEQQASLLGGHESPCSNKSGGEDIGRSAATNNKTSSFMGNDHPIVETVVSWSPQEVIHLENEVVSGKERKSISFPSRVISGKKTLEQSESISSPASSFNLPSMVALNAAEGKPGSLAVAMPTPKALSSADHQQMKSPLEGSVSSLAKKRQEVFLNPPISSQSQQVSMLGGCESPCSNTSWGQEIGRPAANNNKTTSFLGSGLPIVGTVVSGSPQGVAHLENGVVSGKEENSVGFPSRETSGLFSVMENHHRNDGLDTSRLKIYFELSQQGLLTPINAKKLEPLIDNNVVSTPEDNKVPTASKVGPVLSATNNKRRAICSKGLTQSASRLGLGTAKEQRDLLAFQELLSPSHAELSARKRKCKEFHLKDENAPVESGRNQKSPKLLPLLNGKNLKVSSQDHNLVSEEGYIKCSMPEKSWKDIFAKLWEVVSEKFSLSNRALNLKAIDIYKDEVDSWQRSRKYESLCMDIQSAGNYSNGDCKHRERVAEAKLLQDLLLYQRLKVVLLDAKREVLLKRLEKTRVAIEEVHKLEASLNVKKYVNGEGTPKTVSTYPDIKNQEDQKIITLKKEELGMVEKKLMGLMQFFEDLCKLKGNRDADAFVSLTTDYLNKRRCCRDIRRNLLLWIVDDVVVKKDGCIIVLNYRDILSQSFSIKALHGSVISYRNSFRDTDIEKRFPNMKACDAFSFVFHKTAEHMLADSKYLRKVTQMSSLLLGNLLDFLEEVREARLAIPNLVRTVFDCQSAGKLGLDLCFRGRKELTLTLDASDLSCGVYPSEPSKLNIKIFESLGNASSPSFDEIRLAIQMLQRGHLVIKRLCKRVSDII